MWIRIFMLGVAAFFTTPWLALAQNSPASSEEPWAAQVGADTVLVREAQQMYDEVFRGKPPREALQASAKAQVLEEIVGRRLVVAYGQRTGEGPSDADIAKAIASLRPTAKGPHGRKAEPVSAAADTELRRLVVWQLTWQRFLDRYRTAQRRKSYFDAHHADYDGTELTVSHILWRPAAADQSPAAIEALVKQASEVRQEIIAGKVTFKDAAAKYSAGPSRAHGGVLGKIGRHGPMEESFSQAAFALKVGETSEPVRSPFGVHLIHCDEVHAGKKKIADVSAEIDLALAKELLTTLADIERKQTEVKYSSSWPHFKPGTQELQK